MICVVGRENHRNCDLFKMKNTTADFLSKRQINKRTQPSIITNNEKY